MPKLFRAEVTRAEVTRAEHRLPLNFRFNFASSLCLIADLYRMQYAIKNEFGYHILKLPYLHIMKQVRL